MRTWDGTAARNSASLRIGSTRRTAKPDASSSLTSPTASVAKAGELSEADNLKWIQQLADWTSETPDSDEFLGSLKEDLGAAEVYVFTPKGKVVSLPPKPLRLIPYGRTPKSVTGTMGARVNG